MDTFDSSYSSTSLITSVQMGIIFSVSPIASIITKKFGCRKVTIVGSLVAAIGLFSSGLAQSIGMLYMTAGVITGNMIHINPNTFNLHLQIFTNDSSV